jgi:hypothetical protein
LGGKQEKVGKENVLSANTRRSRTLAFMLLVWSLAGCGEWPTSVQIKGGTAPIFSLSGGGDVAILTVYSPDYMTKAKKPDDEDFALWKIKPSGGYLHGTWIPKLGSITYGVVPPGYVQVKPKDGTPLPLVEGQKYFYFVETTNAAGAGGYLEIKNSRAVPTTGSGPCFQHENGKFILVPCWNVGS